MLLLQVSYLSPFLSLSDKQFKAHTHLNKAPAQFRALDYAEKNGYIRGIVKEIIHDSGRYVPIAPVSI
jgi:ribosomal protein L2